MSKLKLNSTLSTLRHVKNRQSEEVLKEFSDLVDVVSSLRSPNGCPWDKEQTHQSLAPYALEETCEMIEAIEKNDMCHLKEELGDVLFQVLLHSEMAEEAKNFTLNDVIQGIRDKIVRRHPHVFEDLQVKDSAEVIANWNQIKKIEKKQDKKIMSWGLPPALPALQTAYKIGLKTQKEAFDWDQPNQVFEKVKEELQELHDAIQSGDLKEIEHEMGDVLFSLAQYARHLGIEPETAVRKTNQRFEQRYFLMKDLIEEAGLDWEKMGTFDKEIYYKKAKEILKIKGLK
jgi:tetrapyrrole methylase family protein/MazG family protein